MQVDANQPICPTCGAARLTHFPILHHMMCAYVGPEYDFAPTEAGCSCPKCGRELVPGARDWEATGTSARCGQCGAEAIVSEQAATAGAAESAAAG